MAVQTSEILRGFVWEKVSGEQGLPSSNFFPYKSSYHLRYLKCCQIFFIPMLQTLNLAVLLSFSCSFSFISDTHKVRPGRVTHPNRMRRNTWLSLQRLPQTLWPKECREECLHTTSTQTWPTRSNGAEQRPLCTQSKTTAKYESCHAWRCAWPQKVRFHNRCVIISLRFAVITLKCVCFCSDHDVRVLSAVCVWFLRVFGLKKIYY